MSSDPDRSETNGEGTQQALPPFSEAVTHAKGQHLLSVEALARVLGVRHSQYHAYLKHNKWPDHTFAALCELCHLPFTTKTAARKLFLVGDAPTRNRKPKAQRQDTFSLVIGQIDEVCNPDRFQLGPRVDNLILKLLTRMGSKHFWFGTTQSIPLAAFSDDYPQVPRALYTAMDTGALFGFVIPNEARIRQLQAEYRYSSGYPFSDLVRRYQKLFEGYIQHIEHRDTSVEMPRHVAGSRMQLFSWNDFPVTPCQQTVTLIGEHRAIGNTYRRVLLRVPVNEGSGALLAPENDAREGLLRDFLNTVMNQSQPIRLESAPLIENDLAARQKFIEQMRSRLNATLV